MEYFGISWNHLEFSWNYLELFGYLLEFFGISLKFLKFSGILGIFWNFLNGKLSELSLNVLSRMVKKGVNKGKNRLK